jgi:hypothetical protein
MLGDMCESVGHVWVFHYAAAFLVGLGTLEVGVTIYIEYINDMYIDFSQCSIGYHCYHGTQLPRPSFVQLEA